MLIFAFEIGRIKNVLIALYTYKHDTEIQNINQFITFNFINKCTNDKSIFNNITRSTADAVKCPSPTYLLRAAVARISENA